MRKLILLLAGLLMFAPLPAAMAGVVTTSDYLQEREVAEARAIVTEHLQRDEVRAQLVDMGVAPVDAEVRVAALSDAEVLQMAQDIEELPAGAAISDTTLILLIILIILLV